MDFNFEECANLDEKVVSMIQLVGELSDFSVDDLLEKSAILSQMKKLKDEITIISNRLEEHTKQVNSALEKYMQENERKMQIARQTIYSGKEEIKKSEPKWAKVVSKRPAKGKAPAQRQVAPNVYIRAFTVAEPKDCFNHPGWWCWCPRINRFCLAINGEILTGNVSHIRDVRKTPIKFREHKRSESTDYLKSDYYVPVERNPNSKDVRQFTNKMCFVPASREPGHNQSYCYRLGEADTLHDDVLAVKPEDYRLFTDLTTGFMLCRTAAAQERRRRLNLRNKDR